LSSYSVSFILIIVNKYLLNILLIFFFFSWILEQIEAGQDIQDLKMNVLQAIQYIIQGWNEVTIKTIQNC